LHFDSNKINPEIKKELEKLKNELTGTSFHDLIIRYVKIGPMLDLLVGTIDYDDDMEKELGKLALMAFDNDNLTMELPWLITSEAKFGVNFGYALGKKDTNLQFMPLILKEYKKSKKDTSTSFLGGYFRAVYEIDREKWENELDKLAQDEYYSRYVSDITVMSGLGDRAGIRILKLVKKGIIQHNDLHSFRNSYALSNLSEKVFTQWVDYLFKSDDPYAAFVALDLFYSYYIRKKIKKIPENMTFSLLTHPSILDKNKTKTYEITSDYSWKEISMTFVKEYPHKTMVLFEKILPEVSVNSFFSIHSQSIQILYDIINEKPKESWNIIKKVSKNLDPKKLFELRYWLRGNIFSDDQNILDRIPKSEIWNWVNDNPDKNLPFIIDATSAVLNNEGDCLARQLLIRYGDNDKIRNKLYTKFLTHLTIGSPAEYYKKKISEMEKIYKNEDNANVKSWIAEFIEILKDEYELEKKLDERWIERY
jgi:hypothetical protein